MFQDEVFENFRCFIRIEVAHSPAGLSICQHKFSLDTISKTGLLGVKPTTFQLEQNHKFLDEDGDIMMNDIGIVISLEILFA